MCFLLSTTQIINIYVYSLLVSHMPVIKTELIQLATSIIHTFLPFISQVIVSALTSSSSFLSISFHTGRASMPAASMKMRRASILSLG